MKKIRILNSNGKSLKAFEEEINQLLKKGWKLKGNMFDSDVLNQVMIKKVKSK